MSEGDRGPLSGAEANSLVAFAVANCVGEPNFLVGMTTTAGPIIVAVEELPESYDFSTDHVADAVNWLVSQGGNLRDPLSELLARLVVSSKRWRNGIASLPMATRDIDTPRAEAIESILDIGDELAKLVEEIAKESGFEIVDESDSTQTELFEGNEA